MKIFSLIIVLFFATPFLYGQVDIFIDKKGNAVKINPPDGYRLEGIEWGDGTFSDSEKEKNLSKKKLQEITVYLTCNSAEGTNNVVPDQPKSKSSIIVNTSLSSASLPDESQGACCEADIAADENLVINNVFKAMPQEEIGLIFSYRNTESFPTDGVLLLCYNEKSAKKSKTAFAAERHFDFVEAHEHFGESPLEINNPLSAMEQAVAPDLWVSTSTFPMELTNSGSHQFIDLQSIIQKEQKNYQNFNAWRYSDLNPKEARNFYAILKGTEEMGKDPGRKITIKGYYVPDGGDPIPFEKTLVINTSHDPNRTAVFPNKLNYRQLDKLNEAKTLSYIVEFQNNGTAPAKDVYIKLPISETIDANSLKVLDYSFKKECLPCSMVYRTNCLDTIIRQDTITFHFKGISLPGTKTTVIKKNGKVVEKKGENIKKRDTQGFIEFTLTTQHRKKKKGSQKLKKQVLAKKDFATQASIIFDNNEPIITNRAKSKFKMGLSPGLKLTYDYNGDKEITSKQTFIGLTLSPYRAKFYPQLEFLYNLNDFTAEAYYSIEIVDAAGNNQFRFFTRQSTGKLYHIPLLAKLDNRWLSMGLGVQLEIADFKSVGLVQTDKFLEEVIPIIITESELADLNKPKTEITAKLVGEISLGKVQKGPSIGLKGIFAPKDLKNYNLHLFASWKF